MFYNYRNKFGRDRDRFVHATAETPIGNERS